MTIDFTESKKQTSFFWPLIKPYSVYLVFVLLAVAVAAGTVLAFGWGLRNLVDVGFSDQTGHYLNQALLVLLGVILVLAASSYTRFYLVHWIAEQVIAQLRRKIYQHLLSLDPTYFETHKTGDQISRMNTDTTVLQMMMTSNVPVAFRHLLTLIGGMVMLFIVSPTMAGMVFAVVPLVVVPIIYFGRKVRSKSRDTQGRIGEISSFGHETIQGLQTIQSFGYEALALEHFSILVNNTFKAALKYVKVRAFLTAFIIAVVFSAIGVVLWMGGHKVLKGEITPGDLSAFIFYAVVTAGAVGALSEAMTAFHQARGAMDRVVSLLSQKSNLKGAESLKAFPEDIKGHLSFNHVSFSYPTRTEDLAMEDVSFALKPGERIAIVGPSGSGKTTVFKLLQRFYDAQKGEIKIDDLDVTEYNPKDVRRYMGIVSQDPAMFSTSVINNIRIGNPAATDEDVRHAAEMAQADDFITTLPKGYNTQVGENGSRLSGGQKQRLAIARVFLKDPKILLLDEATSALDSSNEQAVMEALKKLMQGRTTIVIAHRLSTIQNMDRIIVMDKGKVVASGTHEELYNEDALYTHLAGLQMQD